MVTIQHAPLKTCHFMFTVASVFLDEFLHLLYQ